MRKGFHHSLASRKLISKAGKGRIPWNKNLTKKTSKIIAQCSKHLSEYITKHPVQKTAKGKKSFSKLIKEHYKNNPNMGMKNKKPWNFGLNKCNNKIVRKLAMKKKGWKHTLEHRIKNSIAKRKWHIKQKKLGKDVCPNYNRKACKFFDKINKLYKLKGQHAETKEKEYFVEDLGVWLDFYSKKYNLVIEWNENRHFEFNEFTNREILSSKHIQRQSQIKRLLGCTFINIREKTFKEESIFRKIENVIRQKTIRLVA